MGCHAKESIEMVSAWLKTPGENGGKSVERNSAEMSRIALEDPSRLGQDQARTGQTDRYVAKLATSYTNIDVQEGKYQEMKELARLHSPDIRQIDLDVNRTYRNHSMFRERYNNRQQDLFHVLAAYSMYNSEVGYCQGMSQIAALLLMYLDEEEEAFWALSQLMVDRKYNMHGFFIPQFPRLMRFQEHHDKVR